MRVAVGIPCGTLARYGIFYDSLMHVRGVNNDNVLMHPSGSVARNRNRIAERAIAEGYDAIWYVDDDQVFSPPTLERLVAADKDIVSGLYVKQQVPFEPQLYDVQDEAGAVYPRLLKSGECGLVQTKVVGAGCLLVKTKVFEAMEKPWWRLGQLGDKAEWSDDVDWCRRARLAGFEVWCDQRVFVGHNMVVQVWPSYQDRQWSTMMVNGRDVIVAFPAAQAEPPAAALPNVESPHLVPPNFVKPGDKPHFYQDIHGFFDFEDIYRQAVQESPDPAVFVEVGSWLGRSIAFLAVEVLNSKKKIELHAVDNWKGAPETPATVEFMKANDGRKLFEENMRRGGVWNMIKVHNQESAEAAKAFADGTVDFCFIDAGHDYQHVLADIRAWLPKIRPGGVIAGHDYTDSFVGVKRAVEDCFKDFVVVGNSWIRAC